ncbi:hypothetical protein ACFVQ4_21785 [Streptomyces laurentii]|uniref:hypothetical protein n=1 Tax=Streptomyces laurentii TaxID=39478 RepID=UPI0036A7C69B
MVIVPPRALAGGGQLREHGQRLPPCGGGPLVPLAGVEHPRVADHRLEMVAERHIALPDPGPLHIHEFPVHGECLTGPAGGVERADPLHEPRRELPVPKPVGPHRRDPLGHGLGGLVVPSLFGDTGGPQGQPPDPGTSGPLRLRPVHGQHLGAQRESFGASPQCEQRPLGVCERRVHEVFPGGLGRIHGTGRRQRLLAQRPLDLGPVLEPVVETEVLQGPDQLGQIGGGTHLSEHPIGVDFLAYGAASRGQKCHPGPENGILIEFPPRIHDGDSECRRQGPTTVLSCAVRPTRKPFDLS